MAAPIVATLAERMKSRRLRFIVCLFAQPNRKLRRLPRRYSGGVVRETTENDLSDLRDPKEREPDSEIFPAQNLFYCRDLFEPKPIGIPRAELGVLSAQPHAVRVA